MERVCFTDQAGVKHCIYLPLLIDPWWHWHWPPEESFRLVVEAPDLQAIGTIATLIPTVRSDRLREDLQAIVKRSLGEVGKQLPSGFELQ
jgi:hypothetical protein